MGFPQGGIISPTISNMVLDGLNGTVLNAIKGVNAARTVHFVRYADDFIITGPDYAQYA